MACSWEAHWTTSENCTVVFPAALIGTCALAVGAGVAAPPGARREVDGGSAASVSAPEIAPTLPLPPLGWRNL